MRYFETECSLVPRLDSRKDFSGPFWRMDAPLLQGQKVITGGMFPHQQAWWKLPNFVKLLVGGFGSGKTLIGCKRGLALALTNAPCSVAMVSPTFPMARQTIIPTLRALLAGKQSLYGRAFYWRYNRTTHEFNIKFHGRHAHLVVYTGENPDSLRGSNLAAAVVDEPFIQDEKVFQHMVARVRHPDAVHKEIALTGTPEELNWGYDLCVGAYTEKLDVGFVQASTTDNIALDSDYIKRLTGSLTERAADAYIRGQFVNLSSGLVYYGFDRLSNVVDLQVPDCGELGCGMDFNVDPMSAAVFWRNGDRVHYIEDIELPNADTEYLCGYLREKYPRLRNIYPDATGSARRSSAPGGKSDFFYIESAGFRICAHPSNPKRRDRYNSVNGRLRPQEGSPHITVSPRCMKLIKYLSTYSHENMTKQESMSHLLDAFSYPIAYLWPVARQTATMTHLHGA